MQMKKILPTIFLLLFITSCSFNKLFLQPTKVLVNAKRVSIKTSTDTTVIVFLGNNHQPVFLKNGSDTINFDFTIESVIFKSLSGNNLNGWFLKPKNKTIESTILHFHGNAGFLVEQYQAISSLCNYGFQIFLFDYSGYGFSEGKATKNNILVDGLSALDYVKSRADVKNTQLVLYGQSLGGHLSAVVGAKRQIDIDALVIEGAFSSHKDIGAYKVPIIGRLLVKQGYSAKKSIKDFHKPLLVIHSTEDEEVPFYMGQRIYNAANTPKEFFEIKKCHICGPEFYPNEISQKIKKMLELEK